MISRFFDWLRGDRPTHPKHVRPEASERRDVVAWPFAQARREAMDRGEHAPRMADLTDEERRQLRRNRRDLDLARRIVAAHNRPSGGAR